MTNVLNLRKILWSAIVITFVTSMVFAGTQAFFSDEETSEGNLFTAGAIDLLIDSEQHYAGLVCVDNVWVVEDGQEGTTRPDLEGDPCDGTWAETNLGAKHTFFNFGDLKPGDEGENTISLHVMNNDAYMCAIIDNMVTEDNGCNEPEGEVDDSCGDSGEGQGELQNELHFFAWTDDGATDGWQNSDDNDNNNDTEEGDNIWQDGEEVLFSNESGPASDVIDGKVYPLYTPDNGAITGSTTNYIGLAWCFGEFSITDDDQLNCDGASATNVTQTDSLSADITFYAEQARNNPNFTCPALDEFEEPERPKVGADLAAYEAPEPGQCDLTVTGDSNAEAPEYETIQKAVNAADGEQTICVEDGTYNENVNIETDQLTLAGVNPPTNTATIDGRVKVDATDVTITGFEILGADNVASEGTNGVYVVGGSNGLTLAYNVIDGTDRTGANQRGIHFAAGGTTGVEISNNVVENWDSAGTYINPTVGPMHFSYNDYLSNNVGIGSDGINDVDIMNNHFSENTAEAIGMSENAQSVTDVHINVNNFVPAGDGNDVNAYDNDVTNTVTVDATGNHWDGEATESDRTSDTASVDTSSPEASAFPEN